MKPVRKVWTHLVYGGAICLLGSACWFLWRKASSESSSESSGNTPQVPPEWESWKRATELELAGQFDRVKSLCGRISRDKRSEKPTEGDHPPGEEEEQAALNRMLASKMHGR